jgi:hypothetical protein
MKLYHEFVTNDVLDRHFGSLTQNAGDPDEVEELARLLWEKAAQVKGTK